MHKLCAEVHEQLLIKNLSELPQPQKFWGECGIIILSFMFIHVTLQTYYMGA